VTKTGDERFAIGSGRDRPAFTPKELDCPQCGGGLSLKDEHTELVVCPYCGSHLNVSAEKLKVLGKGPEQPWPFALELGASYRVKGHRYEVIARIAYIEDGDMSECTRDYYLYNPYRGTFWLSEYDGFWSLAHPTHVMPKRLPFGRNRGDRIDTHDGRSWAFEESGTYELVYVDGSLPWLAKVGDTVEYAELSARTGGTEQYEIQRTRGEIEYGRGEALPVGKVRTATGVRDLAGRDRLAAVAGPERRFYRSAIAVAAVALAINLILLLGAFVSGHKAASSGLSTADLSGETFTAPFTLTEPDTVIKVEASAGQRSNAWMAADFALVRADEQVIHVFDQDIQYYHGSDGGESWTEGSRSQSAYIRVPEPGTYRLLVHAVSAHGDAATADTAQHDLNVRVIAGAVSPRYYVASSIFVTFALFLLAGAYQKWRRGDEDD